MTQPSKSTKTKGTKLARGGYPPNTHRWKIGDVVIASGDAKQPEMLMKVIGYRRSDGLCITRYLQPDHLPNMRGTFHNDIAHLHDPADFGLAVPAALHVQPQSEHE